MENVTDNNRQKAKTSYANSTYASLIRWLFRRAHDFHFYSSQHGLHHQKEKPKSQIHISSIKLNLQNTQQEVEAAITVKPIFTNADPLADATAPTIKRLKQALSYKVFWTKLNGKEKKKKKNVNI